MSSNTPSLYSLSTRPSPSRLLSYLIVCYQCECDKLRLTTECPLIGYHCSNIILNKKGERKEAELDLLRIRFQLDGVNSSYLLQCFYISYLFSIVHRVSLSRDKIQAQWYIIWYLNATIPNAKRRYGAEMPIKTPTLDEDKNTKQVNEYQAWTASRILDTLVQTMRKCNCFIFRSEPNFGFASHICR